MKDYRNISYSHSRQPRKEQTPRNRIKPEKRPRKPLNLRHWGRRAGKLTAWMLVPLSVAGLCYGCYLFMSQLVIFPLERIEVSGRYKQLTREEILAISGARIGESVLSLKLKRMGELLAKNPWVDQVRVRRYFPGSLTIDVQEREPVAIINMGYLYYLSRKGEIFKPLNQGEPMDFPVVTGFSEEEMLKDQLVSREALQTALGLIDLLRKGAVIRLDDVSEIHYDKGNGFTLFAVNGGVPIKLGHGDFSAKITRLDRIYKELQAQQPTPLSIDLDYPDRIVVRRT